jgi:hypothetical protein
MPIDYQTIASLLFPEGLLDYFDVTYYEKSAETESIVFHLSEKNIIPEEYTGKDLVSKGFKPPKTIEDFPLRGNTVTLIVKRRRWTIKETKEVVSRDWNLVAKGTRKTHEFASFLKEINR